MRRELNGPHCFLSFLCVEILHRAADLTLVTSHVLGKELQAAGAAAGRFLQALISVPDTISCRKL